MNNISILQRYGIYLLVLVAVVLFVYILISLIQSFSMEHADRKIKEDRSEGVANNIYYFVRRTTLQQIQLSLGILLSGVLIAVLIFCACRRGIFYSGYDFAVAVFCSQSAETCRFISKQYSRSCFGADQRTAGGAGAAAGFGSLFQAL